MSSTQAAVNSNGHEQPAIQYAYTAPAAGGLPQNITIPTAPANQQLVYSACPQPVVMAQHVPIAMHNQPQVVMTTMPQMQQVQYQPLGQQQMQQDTTRADTTRYPHRKAHMAMGIIQLICGGLVIVAQVILVASRESRFAAIGQGIWGGVCFMVAGSLGMGSRFARKKILVATMVLCIISAVVAISVMIISAVLIPIDRFRWTRYSCPHGYNCRRYIYHPMNVAMHSFIVIFSLVEFVIAILQSAYCCRAVCCRSGTSSRAANQSAVVVYLNYAPPPATTSADATNVRGAEQNPAAVQYAGMVAPPPYDQNDPTQSEPTKTAL
ncbi:uncharacterized protein LOC141913214 isoform X2 [Tubulanus polymorphus]